VFDVSWFFGRASAVGKASLAFSGTEVVQSGRGFVNTVPRDRSWLFVRDTVVASPPLTESSILRWSLECRISSVYDGTEYFESGFDDRESAGLTASVDFVISSAFVSGPLIRS
jgi:hypothetical protein